MKKNALFNMLLCISVGLLAISCAAPGRLHQTSTGSPIGNDKEQSLQAVERNIIYDAKMTITAKEPDTAWHEISRSTKKYEGYMLSSGVNFITIRIKSQYLDQAMEEIEGMGKLVNKTVRALDVTEEFRDYKIRLENADKTRATYLRFLDRSTTVEEAVKVQKELDRINERIDLLKGKINRLEHLTAYSTLAVTLREKKNPGVFGYVGIGFYKATKWLFVRN
ncbi:MAG: DUF4349 domain-containing protein [Bacteroidota bacterium]